MKIILNICFFTGRYSGQLSGRSIMTKEFWQNQGGVLKQINSFPLNDEGVLETPNEGWVNHNGVLKQFFPSNGVCPTIDLDSFFIFDTYNPPEVSMPRAVHVTPDGTTIFVGDETDTIYEYTLSTPYDLTSISYSGNSFAFTARGSNCFGLHFSSDGTQMYINIRIGRELAQYTLSTPWQLSSATFTSRRDSDTFDETPWGIFLSDDGTRMYNVGHGNKITFTTRLYQWELSTPFLISSSTLVTDIAPQASEQPNDAWLTTCGKQMLIASPDTVEVLRYTLATAWDLDTASVESDNINLLPVSSGISVLEDKGIIISGDGVSELVQYNS